MVDEASNVNTVNLKDDENRYFFQSRAFEMRIRINYIHFLF